MHYFITNTRLDVQRILTTNSKLLDIEKNSESYNIFDLSKISELDSNINKTWIKLLQTIKAVGKNANNITLVKDGTSAYLKEHVLRWLGFFENSDWNTYQVKEIQNAKVDQQQLENEGVIQKEEQKTFTNFIANTVDDKSKDVKSLIKAATTLTVIPAAITPEFKARFDQKGEPGIGANNMKDWFLKMFLDAETNYGKPVKYITSGYRSQKYQKHLQQNPKLKAAKNSPHVQGVAADISLKGENKQKLIDALLKAGFTRLGIGKSFIHVDAGDKVNPNIWVPYARWSYSY